MNNNPESFHKSEAVVSELLAIRNELKKINHKVNDFEEKYARNSEAAKSWRILLENRPLTIIFILLIVNVLVSLIQAIQSFKPIAYEYEIVSPDDLIFDSEMNEYGRKGWQAVSCRRASDIFDKFHYECIMIRKK